MFTFIKKSSKPARRPRLIRWSRLRLIKTSVVSQSRTRSSASSCAACVNACPSNALTVEADLVQESLRGSLISGAASSVDAAKKSARRQRSNCRKSTNWRCGRKKISLQHVPFLCCAAVASAIVLSPSRRGSTTPLRCLKHNGDSRAENHREKL